MSRALWIPGIVSLVYACLSTPCRGSGPLNWPQFRGSDAAAAAPEQTLPDQFGPAQNVLWKVAIPTGNSSPCIWGDRIFLTGYENEELRVICLARQDGQIQWSRSLPVLHEEVFFHRDCSPATPTPCTDGDRVYSYFGAYGLVAHDLAGNLIWERRFNFAAELFGTGSSPILRAGRLYLVRDTRGESNLFCFDARTGAEIWVSPRPFASEGYGTPFLWQSEAGTQLVVGGSTRLVGYDVADGREVWSIANLPGLVCTSPAASPSMLYFGGWSTGHVTGVERLSSLTDTENVDPTTLLAKYDANQDGGLQPDEIPESRAKGAFRFFDVNKNGKWDLHEVEALYQGKASPGRNVFIAVKPGGAGDITDSHIVWEETKNLPYVASPLLYRERLYLVKKGGILTCLNAHSGDAHFVKRLPDRGEYYATPVGVGDRIVFGSAGGKMFMLKASDHYELVHKTDLGEPIWATPAVVDNTLYQRAGRQLWAFSML